MNKYFSLYEECLLVPEEKNPAIYNTFSGEIYIITQEEAKFLSYLEMGEPFDKASDFAGILPEVAKHYLELYENNKLGSCSKMPKNSSKNFPNYLSLESYWMKPTPRFQIATISLSKLCGNTCDHCNRDETTTVYTCSSCVGLEKKFNNSFMATDMAEKILVDLHDAGCENILFRVPDYTVNKDYFNNIFQISQKLSFSFVAVLIGNSNLTDADLLSIQQYNVIPILQFIINSKEELEHMREMMEHFEKISLNHRYHILTNVEAGLLDLDLLIKLRNERISYAISYDAIIPRDLNSISKLNIQLFNRAMNIPKTSPYYLAHNYAQNECLEGKIYINQDGSVYPCPALTNFYLGNGMDLRAVFSDDKLMNFWLFPKKNLSPCSKCGLKYACTDCRGLDYKLSGDLNANLFCPLNKSGK